MGLLGVIGGVIGGNKAAKAAGAQAAELRAAGNTAFESSRFRPVGVTTAFGTSNYTVDPTTGALTGAGYSLTPEMQAIQGGLLSQAGGMGMDFTGQGLQGAQSLFNLGQQYLAESPQQAAQNYMAQQQALLQPSRDQAQAGLTQNLFNTGRGGVAVAQGGGMGAANPEQQALLNAQAMQDLQLASQAQQQGMRQAEFGAGLFGAGAQAATAGYSPLQTALTGAASLDKLGQQSLGLGMDLGNTASAANARASQLRLGTAAPAAQAQFASSSWSPWASALGGLDKMGDQLMSAYMGKPFGGTPQGAYGQQEQYLAGALSNPQTQQARMLAAQWGE
jgi:hypothetical protein